MNYNRSSPELEGIIKEIQKLPTETEWVEFKRDFHEPEDIGE